MIEVGNVGIDFLILSKYSKIFPRVLNSSKTYHSLQSCPIDKQ